MNSERHALDSNINRRLFVSFVCGYSMNLCYIIVILSIIFRWVYGWSYIGWADIERGHGPTKIVAIPQLGCV